MPAGRLTVGLDAAALFAPLAGLEPIGLAVSGGPDSLALMLLAHRLRPERFVVYTVDHGLRAEARDEAAMVVREAERLGFRARALRWSGRKPATGISAAARAARYRLIGAAMTADGVPVLATAHHRNDQAETILMRLAHGSGIEGLRGMDLFSVVEGVTVVRPLLGVDPADLRALVDAAGLTPAADPSNDDPSYERVRWRQALPQLAALGLTPERLALFGLRLREANAALDATAAAHAATATAGGKAIELDAFRRMPRAIAIRVLQNALAAVGGSRKPHALAAVERLGDRLTQAPLAVTLHGCIVESDGTTIHIQSEPQRGARARRASAHEDVTPH